MRRALALLIAVAGAGLVCAGAALASSAPQDKLTHHEYALLKSVEARFERALTGKKVNWAGVPAICKGLGSSTTLLQTQQASCLAEGNLLEGLSLFPAEGTKCGKTTPKEYECLQPLYTALAQDAKNMYASDVAARQQAVSRGFTGACLSVLADTPKDLTQEHQLSRITATLVKDNKTVLAVAKGQLPKGSMNVEKIHSDANAFAKDAQTVLGESSSGTLSDCAHS